MNFKKIMGVGHYTIQDKETTEYEDGRTITQFTMNLDYMEGMFNQEYQRANYFRIACKIDVSSQGSVTNIGIISLNFSVFYNSESGIFDRGTLNLDGAKSFSNVIYRQLTKGDKVIFMGNLGILYNIDGEMIEETVNFEITHVQPVDPGMYEYSVDLPLIWLTVFYFFILGVVILALARVIWTIRFHMRYTEEDRVKDEYFHSYIKKLAEEKNAENTS